MAGRALEPGAGHLRPIELAAKTYGRQRQVQRTGHDEGDMTRELGRRPEVEARADAAALNICGPASEGPRGSR
jgi:hypothetical protein